MSFSSDLKRFSDKVKRLENDVFVESTIEVQRSIVDGSEITGAPGQPRDTGNLAESWTPEFTSNTSWKTSTNVDYAPHVEANVRGVTFRNHGPHSVALTRLGWPKIAEYVRRRLANA